MISAVCHNIGQLLAAVIFTGTKAVLGYAPVLMIFSVVTGIVTGTILCVIMPVLQKQSRFFMSEKLK